jgi:predicted ATPase/class 3 adenylate cyclase
VNLPTGTVTFLFTDIEGSTRLWEERPDAMRAALARHNTLVADAITAAGGCIFKTFGDAFCASFARANEAVAAAVAVQQALHSEPWPPEVSLRVRMALHTGLVDLDMGAGDYFGQPLNRVARLLATGHGGQVLLSAATQELVRDNLPAGALLADMGEHRLKDLGRPESVFQLCHPNLPSDFPPLRSLDNPALKHNLPHQLTSFIGREKELSEVRAMLGKSRLVTLIGTGGSGKTRLALQVAADLLTDCPDGVWLVQLASLFDTSLVGKAIASVLGVVEGPDRPVSQALSDWLKSRTLLLLLDNAEHLIAPCAELTEALLRSCPHLRILVTSRERLSIIGEFTYRVPSLSAPDPTHQEAPEALARYESVRLFVERASSVNPAFTLTNANTPALVQLCARLDGIPLALELAAARTRSLSVSEINQRLDDRFRLLTSGGRTAVPRQQTLRAAIDWSYDLLKPQERVLLRRLAIFAGGWTLAAAEQVCCGAGAPGEVIESWEVLDLLASLVDKSLVVAKWPSAVTRYYMLETVREYAREKLLESGEQLCAGGRHADFFLRYAEEGRPQLGGPEQAHYVEAFEAEHGNLRQALTYFTDSANEPEVSQCGLRLGAALQDFWWLRGHLGEGRKWLSQLLEQPERREHTAARAGALHGAGMLAWMQGDCAQARFLLEESLKIRRELGDKDGIAYSLNILGRMAQERGDYSLARILIEEGHAAVSEIGNTFGIGMALNNLGLVAIDEGDYVEAARLFEESLSVLRELGNIWSIATVQHGLGTVAYLQGDVDLARSLLEQSLTARHELGDRHGIAYCLEAFALIAASNSFRERAVCLLGAAAALRQIIGSPLPPIQRGHQERETAGLRRAIGEEVFARAWARGQAMSAEQAVQFALDESDDVSI